MLTRRIPTAKPPARYLRANRTSITIRPAAPFVTLNRHGRLRGCMGSLQAHRPLLEDLKANAKAAAFLDPRFEPLTQTEFNTTRVEISVLSAAEPMSVASEADALAQIRPVVYGLI